MKKQLTISYFLLLALFISCADEQLEPQNSQSTIQCCADPDPGPDDPLPPPPPSPFVFAYPMSSFLSTYNTKITQSTVGAWGLNWRSGYDFTVNNNNKAAFFTGFRAKVPASVGASPNPHLDLRLSYINDNGSKVVITTVKNFTPNANGEISFNFLTPISVVEGRVYVMEQLMREQHQYFEYFLHDPATSLPLNVSNGKIKILRGRWGVNDFENELPSFIEYSNNVIWGNFQPVIKLTK